MLNSSNIDSEWKWVQLRPFLTVCNVLAFFIVAIPIFVMFNGCDIAIHVLSNGQPWTWPPNLKIYQNKMLCWFYTWSHLWFSFQVSSTTRTIFLLSDNEQELTPNGDNGTEAGRKQLKPLEHCQLIDILGYKKNNPWELKIFNWIEYYKSFITCGRDL